MVQCYQDVLFSNNQCCIFSPFTDQRRARSILANTFALRPRTGPSPNVFKYDLNYQLFCEVLLDYYLEAK